MKSIPSVLAFASLLIPTLQGTAPPAAQTASGLKDLAPRVALEGDRALRISCIRGGVRGVVELSLDAALEPGARLIEARAASLECADQDPGTVVALVVEDASTRIYRFLMDGPRSRPGSERPAGATDVELEHGFVLCAPLFESAGDPFRIVEVRTLPGSASDNLEITWRREPRKPQWLERPRGFEELLYRNTCLSPALPHVAARLWDLRAGEPLELGAELP